MHERITGFITQQRVVSLCCVDEENHPYCFSCFFAFDQENGLLFFKSQQQTSHANLLKRHPFVAGTIQPDQLNALAVRGIQFTGRVLEPSHVLSREGASLYHRKYPFALAMPGEVWAVQLDAVKMTDNTLAFGKKIHWQRAGEDSSTIIPN